MNTVRVRPLCIDSSDGMQARAASRSPSGSPSMSQTSSVSRSSGSCVPMWRSIAHMGPPLPVALADALEEPPERSLVPAEAADGRPTEPRARLDHALLERILLHGAPAPHP